MKNKILKPDYLFEVSWEVCNKVGGIYTVIATKALHIQAELGRHHILIGPDVWMHRAENPDFPEDPTLFSSWKQQAATEDLRLRIGRWNIPGKPIAILVDFKHYLPQADDILTDFWKDFGVDSISGNWDYKENALFGWAAGKTIESFWNYNLQGTEKVVAQFHEWQTGAGVLQLKRSGIPVATAFTTHATMMGRCIAGNGLPLYDAMSSYDGDELARRFGVVAIHSLEKKSALNADVFTTVSDITARECKQFHGREVDVVTPNGFENSFTPASDQQYNDLHDAARERLQAVASAMSAEEVPSNSIYIGIGGRYEFRNKGIDVFVEAMNRLLRDRDLKKKVLAFIEVPGWVGEPRKDLQERLKSGKKYDTPLDVPQVTHWLHNMSHDNVLGMLKYYDMHNRKEDRVKVIFLPCYLDGKDGIVDMTYYDVVLGNDLCIYPSYYEPWGYTPLEAIAFKVPCITTDLAGFGLWANKEFGHYGELTDGVKVIHRTDYNYSEVADNIKDTVAAFSAMDQKQVDACRKKADQLSKKALWSEFIEFYHEAYDIALRKAEARQSEK